MPDYKQYYLDFERDFLSSYAQKSAETKGRQIPLEPCPLRTEFQRDRDRILHIKAFRRLKHKTQVFLSPEGDHYRTRLTHTLEVSQIARTISRALRLNEDLTEAIALGHDLGHTPFGHAGERALQKFTHFEHNEQSLRVVDVLEYDFKGMNLTFEVRDGILNHTSKGQPKTLEGGVVSLADRIAYVNHDIDDALRAGVIKQNDIPERFHNALGKSHGRRISAMINGVIAYSFNKPVVSAGPEMTALMRDLREFMFEKVYTKSAAKEEEGKAIDMLCFLFEYYKADLSRLPEPYRSTDATDEQKVCDYIASMTDRYAVSVFKELSIPKSWAIL